MSRRKRILAAAFCIVVALCMFASTACVALEAAHRHSCVGEDCPVCQLFARIGQLRRGFGLALLVLLLVRLALVPGRVRFGALSGNAPALCTLVGRKIRLND